MTTESVEMRVELFESLKGETLGLDVRPAGLLLAGVRRLPIIDPSVRAPFALDLIGPAAEPLGQGSYHFHHERLGSQLIFIVPVGQDASSRFYEAIFN